MGFSLQSFMHSLHLILNNDELNDADKFKYLIEEIKSGTNYAAECGLIVTGK
jgi:hypothetical protein